MKRQKMGLRITFDLEDDDLKHFQLIMREARQAAANLSSEQILQAARSLLEEVESAKPPTFIRERLERLTTMIDMVEDDEWRLPAAETKRVMNALAYFGEPEDLIPDHIPGLGFLDDAIMVELVVRELKHELDAYSDFCEFRARESEARRADGDDLSREQWLRTRRQELHSRMRRRRRGDRGRKRGRSRGSRRSPMSLF